MEEKSDYVNGLSFDFNAEYLISCLIKNGIGSQEINAVFDGHLKRIWSNDISFSEVEPFDNGDSVLALHLNRSGIYDLLPEALFHNFAEKESATGKEMAKESMAMKIEEKEARSFFRPFENELFLQGVKLTTTENNLFEQIFSDFLNGLIPNFWKIDPKIPKSYREKLIKVLPFAHKITGNYKLTAQCLQYILNEKVNIRFGNNINGLETTEPQTSNKLGKTTLGVNSVCGNFANGFIGKLVFIIGPVTNTEMTDFLNSGDAKKLIECFYKYVVPVELDVETQLIFEKQENEFILTDSSEEASVFLGLNTFL